ncbi:hypothetical protein F2Q69_00033895 [Brassica cretica]|uniref:Uncharacterized protein n=1 Tax=Brassica cretica TaxID=69181 RepID=A0A8S9SQ80_BRACR|nr:hypothetical protein F2Q69_00033895 [Brassica cretica]
MTEQSGTLSVKLKIARYFILLESVDESRSGIGFQPRGRVQGSSELEDPLQPSTSGNLSAAEDLAEVGLVVDITDFGEEAVVHVEDEPVIGEFHQDPDSDSSGDDDSETE